MRRPDPSYGDWPGASHVSRLDFIARLGGDTSRPTGLMPPPLR
jgi:hypothetical protein